jgi:hypothetical protein
MTSGIGGESEGVSLGRSDVQLPEAHPFCPGSQQLGQQALLLVLQLELYMQGSLAPWKVLQGFVGVTTGDGRRRSGLPSSGRAEWWEGALWILRSR